MVLCEAARLLHLKTALGDGEIELIGLSGREEMSRLFTFSLDMISENRAIRAPQMVGTSIGFGITLSDGSVRPFHGCISQFVAGDEDEIGRRTYRAEVVPWLWMLTQSANCRVFQQMTVPAIIEKVFQDLGFSDYEIGGVKAPHKEWEYCVQYRESDFDFVSRLMEQEGIFYYFRHENDKHLLILADQPGIYQDCPEATVDYPASWGSRPIHDHITGWEHRYDFHSGRWAQTDYNFETPRTSLLAETVTTTELPGIQCYEVFDYPGQYSERSVGATETRLRMEEAEAAQDVAVGTSWCRTFSVGATFAIGNHRSKEEVGRSYVLTSVVHHALQPVSFESNGDGQAYRNSFTCIPSSVTFRPARSTPKPIISGPQTAIVVGPKGEEIYCDQYGRVKVQFHWDRVGKMDEKSSVWIRTSHQVAGKKWGFVALPRIGQEVVVDFLEGDPDRPLIVGSVYNAEQIPHYSLPDEKTKSYFKTNSSTGGEGFNELMFEDQKDDERVFVHAQKNMDVRVLNDSKSRILKDRHQIIGTDVDGEKVGDQLECVYRDQHLNVKRHQVEHVEGNVQLMIGNGEADDGGNLDVVVEKKKTEWVQGDSDRRVEGDLKDQVGGDTSHKIGGDQQTKVTGKMAAEAGGEIHLKAGTKIIIEATQQISLVGPGGFVDIGPAGVTIQGTLVNINSGGAAGVGSGCAPQAPDKAKKAKPNKPMEAHNSTTGFKSARD